MTLKNEICRYCLWFGNFLTNLLEYLINYCESWYEKNKCFDYIEETYNNSYRLKIY